MRWTGLGLITGLVAGLALALGGFGEFLIVLIFGAIGLVVGKIVDGELDVTRYLGGGSGARGGGSGRHWRRDT